jgi:hybrid polyketide synthase/nonribosomal peptide synthetase ACE1
MTKSSDFFNSGGSSLSLVSLQLLIQQELGIHVSIARLFGATTLGDMAKMLQEHETEITLPLPVDWDQEAQPDEALEELPVAGNLKFPSFTPEVVILTGATGFLGKEILRQLLEDFKPRRIHCIATRTATDKLHPIFAHPSVTVHQGDLRMENVGLSESTAEVIFEEADVLLHVGADVSFMKTYQSLRSANVEATKELARACLRRRIPFHFVSSATVARLSGLDKFGPYSVAPYPPVNDADDAYTASKWVGEVYLEHMSRRFGLPTVIHRPSSITGQDAPETDLMSNILKYAALTKSVPESGLFSGYLDFVSVEGAARSILETAMLGDETIPGDVRYVYQAGERVVGMNQIESGLGLSSDNVRKLPLAEWIDAVIKAGMNPLLGSYLRRMATKTINFPRLEK